jgi:hypothetical protein
MQAIGTVDLDGEQWVVVKRQAREDFREPTAKAMENAGIVARLTVRRHGGCALYHVNDYGDAGLGPRHRAM